MTNSNSSANTVNNTNKVTTSMTNNVFANTSSFRNKFTTTNNNMTNNKIVAYEIAVNVGILHSEYDGQTKCRMFTVHNGGINTNKADSAAFLTVNSTPLKGEVTPVFAVYEDGTTEQISGTKFWSLFVGTTNGAVNTSRFLCDLGLKAAFLRKARKEGVLQSIRIRVEASKFNEQIVPLGVKTVTTPSHGEIKEVTLRIQNADVQISDVSKITGARFSNTLLSNVDLSMEENTSVISNSTAFFGDATPTSNRSKASVSAARASVQEAPVAPIPTSHEAHFSAPTPKPAPKAAPVVDTEKEALRQENAELREEVKSLKTELASTNAKLDQILAMMSAQAAPVAEPTPVVEEPVAEEIPSEEPIAEEATIDLADFADAPLDDELPEGEGYSPFDEEDEEDEVDGDDFFSTSIPSGKAAV